MNAGHPPPLVLLPDGTTQTLAREPVDLMLGVHPDVDRHDHCIELSAGSTLVLYTDGLIETRTANIATGIETLRASLSRHRRLSVTRLVDEVMRDLVGVQPDDDTALLVIRVRTGE